jgi:hypothetical protein
MLPIIVLHLPEFVTLKEFLSRWYVISRMVSARGRPATEWAQNCSGGKVFPAFTQLYL